MKKLIEILTILSKHGDVAYPLAAEHDIVYLNAKVPASEFSAEDRARLEELGANVDEDHDCFYLFV